MAHFGLTALGPQSPYIFKHRYSVAIFPIEEFATAFDAVSRGSPHISLNEVEAVLRIVFHGSAFSELPRVINALAERRAAISREVFLDTILKLQKDDTPLQEDRQLAAHYDSHGVLASHKARSVRPTHAPKELYAEPLTLAAEVGWRAEETPLGDVRYPKKHCAETKYAAALLSSGVL
jgi:hypothetical protein